MSHKQGFWLIPTEGGLSGDPSVLSIVNQFLEDSDHYDTVIHCVEKEVERKNYLSLMDFLLVELIPQFEGYQFDELCSQFYEGNGKPLRELCEPSAIRFLDEQLRDRLHQLVSGDWSTWQQFKQDGPNWESL